MTSKAKKIRLLLTSTAVAMIASTLSVGATPIVGSTAALAQGPVPAAEPYVDVENLDPVPERMWGVSGQDPAATQTPSLDVLVWDIEQVGDRMFVAGGFLNVQESKYAQPISQPFLAAFDVRTGEWIDTFRPQFDRVVYSLAEYQGTLLVGGEFEQVNGQARTGLVAIDPQTGATNTGFAGFVERPWSELRAMVRDIKVTGNDIYVVGNFSHLNGAYGVRTRVYKAGKLIGAKGEVEATWKPQVTGSGTWAVDTNPARTEVYLTGYFTAVNGEANTGYFHTVDTTTGASVAGKIDVPRNLPGVQPEFFDVAYGSSNVFIAGEQHVLQVVRESDQQMTSYYTTGGSNDGFEWTGGFAGGAFQAAERIGDFVFAGCHCPYSVREGNINHYSSVSGQRTPHRLFMAYDASTGALQEDFVADVHSPGDGAWTFSGDTYGCLWAGGDYHVGGVDNGTPRWLGGFARHCPTDFDPDAPLPPEPDPNTLVETGSSWRYNDSGADLGTTWREPSFNDAAWATGDAEFGFGEGDEATLLTPGVLTTYARTSFEFTGQQPNSLIIRLKADDGAVVYLNGVELVRDNLPDGQVTHLTPASQWKGGDDENFVDYAAPATALVEGTNVLAAEVHNVWRNNADLSLDVALVQSDAAPPVVEAGPLVDQGALWQFVDGAAQAPANWTAGIAGQSVGQAPLGFGEPFIATFATPGEISYYFTSSFTVADAAQGSQLNLRLLADDGAVVYVNGTEVHRFNMPDGPIDAASRPTAWVSGSDETTYVDQLIPADVLVNGENVIAVEVHNFWSGNSDLSFDLSLDWAQ